MNPTQSTETTNLEIEVIDCEDETPITDVVVRRATTITRKPQPTEAFKVFDKSLKFLAMFGILIGCKAGYEWKRNGQHILFKVFIALFWVLNIYTQYQHVSNDEMKRVLEQFAMYGTGFSVVFKIQCFEKYFKNITALNDSTYKICQQNDGYRGETLTKRLNANHSFYKFLCILTLSIGVMYLVFPIKGFTIDHQLVSLLPIEIMFVDQSNRMGFLFANFIFSMFGVLGISAIAYVALSFDIAIMSYAPRVDLLQIDINELDELWHTSTVASTVVYRHMVLKNICQKCIDLKNYIIEIKRIFEHQFLLCFIVMYISQILCLYQIHKNNWMNGVVFVLGMFLEMIFCCFMGTRITIENERLCYIITQSKWYTYDVDSQNLILILLNLSMNLEELWIGPFMPLSVLTATEITKSIYSYYTIMSEIL